MESRADRQGLHSSGAGRELLGREPAVAALVEHALAGHTVLLYGPWGIGKSVVLDAVALRVAEAGRPCAWAPKTAGLGDITDALAAAWSRGSTEDIERRRLRAALRNAIEARPGVLLCDHFIAGGTAVKGFFRSLVGYRLGVVIAVDAEHARDHAHARALGLAYRELALPRLGGRYMGRVLDGATGRTPPLHPLAAEDRAALLEIAEGRPGWILGLVRRLAKEEFWRDGRVRVELLRTDLVCAAASHYLHARPA